MPEPPPLIRWEAESHPAGQVLPTLVNVCYGLEVIVKQLLVARSVRSHLIRPSIPGGDRCVRGTGSTKKATSTEAEMAVMARKGSELQATGDTIQLAGEDVNSGDRGFVKII